MYKRNPSSPIHLSNRRASNCNDVWSISIGKVTCWVTSSEAHSHFVFMGKNLSTAAGTTTVSTKNSCDDLEYFVPIDPFQAENMPHIGYCLIHTSLYHWIHMSEKFMMIINMLSPSSYPYRIPDNKPEWFGLRQRRKNGSMNRYSQV